MTTFGRVRALGLAALLCCLTVGQAHAYVILTDNFGNPMSWNKATIGWAVAANGSDDIPIDEAVGALQAAFNSWESVSCSTVSFQFTGTVNVNPNKDIFIRWLEQNWDMTVQDALGVTTNWQLNGDGSPKKVEIFLNGASYVWATSGADDPFSNVNDLQAVATHEIGHAIGLDHPRHRFSTMWFTTFPGESEEARSLEDDDKRAACFLYPAATFTDGQLCDSCWNHQNCVSGACINYPGDGPFCAQDCSGGKACPSGYECIALMGGYMECLPVNQHCAPVGGNIPVGDFCYDHATCASGYCLVLPDSAVCTQQCNPSQGGSAGCPSGMVCAGQGTNGICYPQGSGQLGDSCLSPADCASFDCIGIGASEGACTQPCTSDAQCPGTYACVFDFCVATGSGQFGDSCTQLTDCASGLCVPFVDYCSTKCSDDAECPGDLECINNLYCDAGATGQVGDTCGPGAKECVSGLFCFYDTAAAVNGTCREKCDVRYDDCSGGQYCDWVWQDWQNKVVGVCVGDNGGAPTGAPCGGPIACFPDHVCADTDGSGPKCRQDCNSYNLLGCSGGTTCIPLNMESDPKLGACHPNDGAPAVDDPQVVETVPGVEPPPVAEPSEDTGAIEPGMRVETDGPGLDGAATAAGTTTGGATTGGPVGSGGGSDGGCSVRSSSSNPLAVLGLTFFGIGWLVWRRRCPSVFSE